MTAIPSNTNQVNHSRLTIDVKGKGQHGTLNDMVISNSDFAVGRNVFEFSLPQGVNYIDVNKFFVPKQSETSSSFRYKGFKLVHVNSRGKSVVLIDVLNFAEGQMSTFDQLKVLGMSEKDRYSQNGIDLGFFRINQGDRIFIEIDVLNVSVGRNQVFSFLSSCDTSLVSYYNLCRLYLLSKGQTHTLKRKDFDAVFSEFVAPSLKINGSDVFLPDFFGQVLNSDVYLSCGNDSFVIEGVSDEEPALFVTQKQVHNADTFHLMQEYLKRAKNVLMEKNSTDYTNTIFKQLYGKMPTLDKLNSAIELYSQLNLNDRNFGHEDFYEIPEYVEPNNLIS